MLAATILKRREQVIDEDDEAFPYNDVEVLGPSQTQDGTAPSTWNGSQSLGLSLKPLTAFGAVVDLPLGAIEEQYEIVSVPERRIVAPPVVQVIEQGDLPTPEQIFAADAAQE